MTVLGLHGQPCGVSLAIGSLIGNAHNELLTPFGTIVYGESQFHTVLRFSSIFYFLSAKI
jgi:hypothetical protein